MKMGVEPTPETSLISITPQAMDSIKHSFPVTNKPLLKTLQISLNINVCSVSHGWNAICSDTVC